MNPGATPDELFLALQEALAGEYSLVREIGRGGMGVVYLAREVRLARQVAIKVLPPALGSDEELREQFVSEAQMAAGLSHPNIVPIHRVGEAGPFVYFAMAYVPGITLGEQVRTRGPLLPQQAVKVLREIAWALTYAHATGIVHRDVKPDNMLLEEGTGRTLVTDFGIARASAAADRLSGPGRVVGTAHVMSPEQAMGEPVDARSDIYSLGVVAYFALTGRLPFEAPTPQQVMARHLNDRHVPIRSLAPAVPLKLSQAVECCLAKNPDERFQRASDFADAVDASVEDAKETPAPVRVWIAQDERSRTLRVIGGLWLGVSIFGSVSAVSVLIGIPAGVAVFGAVVLLPTVSNTRRLLRAGYTIADLREGMERHWVRRREELAVEHADVRRLTLRTTAVWTGVTAAVAAGVALLVPAASATVGLFVFQAGMVLGGIVALFNYRRWRAKTSAPFMHKFWGSRWGERLAKLAAFRLNAAPAQKMLPQATEVALGRATDALYEALPKELRKELAQLPETVRRLEADASGLREQIRELEASIASLDEEGPRESATSHHAESLRADLRRLRDRSNDRLATTVAALENIRLGLLRLQLGNAPVASMTTVLNAAASVVDDLHLAAEAREEVERAIHATRPYSARAE